MKRLLLLILSILLLAQSAWGAVYYVDKRCATYNGNGSSPTCATSNYGVGAFNKLGYAFHASYVVNGTHTIEVAPNSGPYLTTDLRDEGFIYASITGSLTVNMHGNTIQTDVNVNDGTYKWTQSGASGKTDWYYLTTTGGTATTVPQTKSAIVRGYWSAETTNLVSGFTLFGHYATDNWAWGDYDSLGFSTLYVKYNNGVEPTGGEPIYVPLKNNTIYLYAGYASLILNDAIIRGSNVTNIYAEAPVQVNRCIFYNADMQGIILAASGANGSKVYYSKFVNCGHRGITVNAQAGIDVYNNYFENVHLMLYMASNTVYTVNFKNNSSKKLLAGAIQKDVVTPTLTESNNQFHIDPNTTHASAAIAFTTATPRWTTTAVSDIPSNTTTTNTTGVDGRFNSIGQPMTSSPCINKGVSVGLTTDFLGHSLRGTPDIGAYEYWGTKDGGSFNDMNFSLGW